MRCEFPSLAILWVQDRFLASAKFRRLAVLDQLAKASEGVRGVVKRDRIAEGKDRLLCSRIAFASPEDVDGSRWLDPYYFLCFLDTAFDRYDAPTSKRCRSFLSSDGLLESTADCFESSPRQARRAFVRF
jgi:hypothetical protein